jgi:hypothetical protein
MSIREPRHEIMSLVEDGENLYGWIRNYYVETIHQDYDFYI